MALTRKQPPPPAPSQIWQAVALLAVLLLAQLLVNVYWLTADNRLAADEIATHVAQAEKYREALFGQDAGTMMNRLVRVGDVAPGNPPAPLLAFFGGIALELGAGWEDAPVVVNTIALMLLLIAVFVLALRFLDPMMALLSAAIAGLLPIVFAVSRVFAPDMLLTALLCWTVYAALRSDGFRRGGWGFLAGILAGHCLLASPSAWIYLVPLAVVTGIMGLLAIAQDSQRGAADAAETGKLGINLLIAFVVGGGVASPWYFRNAEALSAAAKETAEAAPDIVTASDPLGLLLSWGATAINDGVFLAALVLAVIGMITALVVPAFRKPATGLLFFWPLLVLFLAIPYLGTPSARALLPLLPALAVFAALPVAAAPVGPPRRVLAIAVVIVLLIPFGNLSIAPYGAFQRVDIPLTVEEDGDVLAVYREALTLAPGIPVLSAPVEENRQEVLAESALDRAAREEEVRQVEVAQVEDTSEIDRLGTYDLFLLIRGEAFDALSPTLQAHAKERFKAAMSEFPADYKIHDSVTFVQADIVRLDAEAFEFRFAFRVDAPVTKDWRMYLRGHVSDDDLHYLPPDYRAQGYIEWTTETNPPATKWEPGSFVILPLRVNADPIRYQLKLGFFDEAQGFFGRPVVLDDVDLGAIPE